MPKNKIGECTICGQTSELTREHVIPKSFYGEVLPVKTKMITVGSCIACNQGASEDERKVRDLLGLEVMQYEHELTGYFDKKIKGNTNLGKSKVGKAFETQNRLKELGLVPSEELVLIENEVIQKVFKKMVRGLYFYFWHERLRNNCKIKTEKMKPVYEWYQLLEKIKSFPDHIIVVHGDNDEIFGCAGLRGPHPYQSQTRWFFSFYRKIIYITATEPEIYLPGPITDKIWL